MAKSPMLDRMPKSYFAAGLAIVAALAFPVLAADSTATSASADVIKTILGQGITGAIAIACLLGLVFKDRQLTAERDAWAAKLHEEAEKRHAFLLAQGVESAKQTAVMERLLRHMERSS